MAGSMNPASIAASISVGTALLTAFFTMAVATRAHKGAAADRDTVASIMFGIAFLLILLNGAAAALIASGGMAYIGLLKASLLLTAAFAVTGMAFGLLRGMRSGRRIKTPTA